MADLAFLATQTDSALLAGNATALPAGGVAPGVGPQGEGAPGTFAGLFNERLQTAIQQSAVSGEGSTTAGQEIAAAGNSAALDGNGLPLPLDSAALMETAMDSDAAAALAALLPGESALNPLADDAAMPSQVPTDQVEAIMATLGQQALPGTTPAATTLAQNTPSGLAQLAGFPGTQPTPLSVPANTMAPQLANAALPVVGETDPTAAQAAPVVPLGRPVSVAARLALARAGVGPARGADASAAADTGMLRDSQLLSGVEGLRLKQGLAMAAANGAAPTKFSLEQMLAVSPQDTTTSGAADATSASLLSGMQRPGNLSGTSFGSLPTFSVPGNVGQPGWTHELGQRVSWMANSELREAQLQLHPRSLGAVEVRIAFGADQSLQVNFSAAHPVAREALDASLPRLRELFEQQGLNLADATVSQESFAEQQQRRQSAPDEATAFAGHGESAEIGASLTQDLPPVTLSEGLLSAYA